MIAVRYDLEPRDLRAGIDRLFELSGGKILQIEESWKPEAGTPVFTVAGRYTTRGWTEWTQGFQFGSALLQYDATGEQRFLEIARRGIGQRMAGHVSAVGVHDHGFNNLSTYGNLLRLCREGGLPGEASPPAGKASPPAGKASRDPRCAELCELALKVSGAVQAARWTELPGELGYVYSFNGAHSLFVDTMRSLRSLAAAHRLGHRLMGEQDRPIDLLERLLRHAETTARYIVYFGEGRDHYDLPELRGRTAHEAIFNVRSGAFRCPSTQQGYSPFTTWTRGQAWALLGYAEQLEFLQALPPEAFTGLRAGQLHGREAFLQRFEQAATALADFYLDQTPSDGIPYWDTGAPGLAALPGWRERPADPYNDHEPVDSSAAAIAAQGLLRLGRTLRAAGSVDAGRRYFQAGLIVTSRLLEEPYLCADHGHQGLILHSVYHRPNGWDHVPEGRRVPCGESSMWGDYHARELALYVQRLTDGRPYYDFWSCL